MQQRRVVLVGDARLFSTGVALLLQAQPSMDVSLVDVTDPAVLTKIKQARAAVIVVPSCDAGVSLPVVARILRENPGARVIAVGLEQTEINIYRSERVVQASPEELLLAIEEG